MKLKHPLPRGQCPEKEYIPLIVVVQAQVETHLECRLAIKAKAVQISISEVLIIARSRAFLNGFQKKILARDLGPSVI